MLLMCWISLRNTLYFTLMIVSTLPLTHGAHAHRQYTAMHFVLKMPNNHTILHRPLFILTIIVTVLNYNSNSSHEIAVFRVLREIDEVISGLPGVTSRIADIFLLCDKIGVYLRPSNLPESGLRARIVKLPKEDNITV
jgi:hypothetical protein